MATRAMSRFKVPEGNVTTKVKGKVRGIGGKVAGRMKGKPGSKVAGGFTGRAGGDKARCRAVIG